MKILFINTISKHIEIDEKIKNPSLQAFEKKKS